MSTFRFNKYNQTPDTPDFRDFSYQLQSEVELPTKVDLRQYCSRIEQQGTLGSCTGNSVVGALEILLNKNEENFIDLSRLFAYYNVRMLEKTTMVDAGATLRNTIKALANYGVCSERLQPYNINKFSKKPPQRCYKDGTKRKITQYYRLNTLKDKLTCLASGYPFVFGFMVYKSFETYEVSTTGKMTMPKKYDKALGGHAVCAVGYDLDKKILIVRNSWGYSWGDQGYFYMPLDYITNLNLSDDFQQIVK